MRSRLWRTPSRDSAPRPDSKRGDDGSKDLALVAIVAGLLWSIGAIDLNAPSTSRVALLLAGLVGIALHAARVRTGAFACVYAVAIAAVERLARTPLEDGSDVVRATAEAIDVVLAGGNPYTHVMLSTDPVGSPFVYPPGEMLFYLPARLLWGDITHVEQWAGILTVVVLALAALRVGASRASLPAMLYATWGIAAFRTVDGGNDVAAALPVVAALVLAALPARAALVASAVAFGWALAFKQFAVLALPPLLRHLAVAGAGWRRYAAIAVGTAAALTLPFFLGDPGALLRLQVQALTFHDEVWGANLLSALAFRNVDVEPLLPLFFAAELVVTSLAAAVVVTRRVDTIGRAALLACLSIAVPLLLAKWTTQSYFVYAATLALAGLALLNARARYQTGGRRVDDAENVGGSAS